MPRQDKKRLEYLFRELIIYGSAGYTLLGHKPVSFEGFYKPDFEWNWQHLWHAFFPSNLKKYRAWKTWQKYEHLFSQGDILIWSEPNPWIKNGVVIVVANQRHIDRVLQECSHDFAALHDLDPKALFTTCLQSDALLGTLLGYGRTNAWLFHEKNRALLTPAFTDELNRLFDSKTVALHFTFGWPDKEMAATLMYPNFMADPNIEETKQLKSDYIRIRERILSYYADKDFLEATFLLLSR